MVTEARRREIAEGLEAARRRIAIAEIEAGRDPGSVDLVVVTKTHGADEVEVLADLGVVHVGENRDQEAAPKAQLVEERHLVWHFIGQLQTNKARSVVGAVQRWNGGKMPLSTQLAAAVQGVWLLVLPRQSQQETMRLLWV